MKYLMLDTNIYIDMIVARSKSHKSNSYDYLKKLLEHGEITLLVPKIVKTEVFRYIDSEISKVGTRLSKIKKEFEGAYWFNHTEELEWFEEKSKSMNKNFKELDEKFIKNREEFENVFKDKINYLFENKNCIQIEENENIIHKAIQRRIYKIKPFHYDSKNENKDSTADAVIIETLINIGDMITIERDDTIIFISRNWKDFSDDNKKELLHEDIQNSLDEKKLTNQVVYSIYFTKTLMKEFANEIEEIGLTEEWMLEAEIERKIELEESYLDIKNFERESAGLTSLSGDFESMISENEEIVGFMNFLEEINTKIDNICEEYDEQYSIFYEKLDEIDVRDTYYFKNLKVILDSLSIITTNKDDTELIIHKIVDNFISKEFLIENIEDKLIEDTFYYNGTLMRITDTFGNEYTLTTEGECNPNDGGSDEIIISFFKNNLLIENGEIQIDYGFIEFDSDGNAADGRAEDITINLGNIQTNISEVVELILEEIELRIKKIVNFTKLLK